MTTTAILACLPVILVLVLLIRFRMAADTAGFWALALTVATAWLWCGTAPSVILRAGLAGAVGSLPVALVLGASVFQIVVMEDAGAMQRLVTLMKSVAPGRKAVQIMLLNMGFGILLTSLGATTVAILPPIMIALGYSAFAAVILPAIGYEALCSYALLGVPVVVFAGLTGSAVSTAGLYFAFFMPAMSTAIALGMLWLAGGFAMIRRDFVPALLAGLVAGLTPVALVWSGMITLTGVFAGLAVILALLLYLRASGRPLTDASALGPEDRESMRRFSLVRACSPWLALIVTSLLLNTPALPFFEWTFRDLAMPVELVPGAPEYTRVFWQPWFWVFVSTLLCAPLLRHSPAALGRSAVRAWKRAFRPCLSAVLFFALAYIMNHSGKNADWMLTNPADNMVEALAFMAARLFGGVYPLIAPFLGLAGGFLAGSQTSSMAMFTSLHMTVSANLQASGLVVAAASGVGGGLASVVSPSKVSLAAASIERPDLTAAVMKPALAVVLTTTALLGIMTWILAYGG